MKKMSLPALVACAVMIISSQAHGWEFSLDDYVGSARYKEKEGTVKSDWSAFYNRTTLSLGDYDNEKIEGDVRLGVSITATATETWNVSDVEYQTNDMSFLGVDMAGDIGWAFSTDMGKNAKAALTPLLGYKCKLIRFTRNNFVILNTITMRETIDEGYNLHFLDLGGRASAEFGDKVEIFAKPIFGIGLYNSAHNSSLGTVKGGGGFLFNLDTGINYLATKDLVVGVAFTCEIQRLTGGGSGDVIWPDNSLDTYGGTVSLKYRF